MFHLNGKQRAAGVATQDSSIRGFVPRLPGAGKSPVNERSLLYFGGRLLHKGAGWWVNPNTAWHNYGLQPTQNQTRNNAAHPTVITLETPASAYLPWKCRPGQGVKPAQAVTAQSLDNFFVFLAARASLLPFATETPVSVTLRPWWSEKRLGHLLAVGPERSKGGGGIGRAELTGSFKEQGRAPPFRHRPALNLPHGALVQCFQGL